MRKFGAEIAPSYSGPQPYRINVTPITGALGAGGQPTACASVFMGQLDSNFMRHHSKFRAGHEHFEDRY